MEVGFLEAEPETIDIKYWECNDFSNFIKKMYYQKMHIRWNNRYKTYVGHAWEYIPLKKPFAPYITALSTFKCLEWQAKKPRENYTREFQELWNKATLGRLWFPVKELRLRGTPESTEDTINAISVDGTTINLSANLAG